MTRASAYARSALCALAAAGIMFAPLPVATEALGRHFAGGIQQRQNPLYGVTLDDVSDPGAIAASLQQLPHRPTARIYFDVGERPRYYADAIRTLGQVSSLMGELLDSSDERRLSTSGYEQRVSSYLAAFGSRIALWEIGNEVNGNWTGAYAEVAAKLDAAYSQVAAAHKRSALTLYYNVGCGDGPAELDPIEFSRRYVAANIRRGLSLVLLSYYEQACGGHRPSVSTWTRYFARLHSVYPNASLGFGEIGLQDPANGPNLNYAEGMARYYYGLRIRLRYFVGGYFWWYYVEDCVSPHQPPLCAAISDGFRREARSLR